MCCLEKAILPVAISYSTTPKENRSVRASSSSPRACSGDMYATVPSVVPGLVKSSSDAVGGCDVSNQRGSVVSPAYLGQAKIQNLRLAASRHENVCWLDVAMHDPLRVGRVQRIGDFRRQLKHLFERQRLSAEQMLQRLSFQQFHGDEVLAVRFVDLVNGADVRVIERGGGKGFPLESFSGRGIILHFRGQKFQRDMAAQLEVFGFVDHTHPAAAELRQNAVMRDGFPDHRRFEREIFRALPGLL